jgi:hypothetical protein
VEYLIDDRDGQLYYYDVNALSNFVADAPRVIGFDPFARLVDWLERELAARTEGQALPQPPATARGDRAGRTRAREAAPSLAGEVS